MSVPHVVSGKVHSSSQIVADVALVQFTTSYGTDFAITNASGEYALDLNEIGYDQDGTISYSAKDKFENEVFSGSFTVSGGSTSLDITLSARIDVKLTGGNRSLFVHAIGGNPVSSDNPFPVEVIGAGGTVDLVNNPETSYGYSGTSTLPESETVEIRGTSYIRYFTYDASKRLTVRSRWEKL